MYENAEEIPPGLKRRLTGLFGLVIAVWATNFVLSLLHYVLPKTPHGPVAAQNLGSHPATSIFGLLLLVLFFSFALKGRRWAHVMLCIVGFANVILPTFVMLGALFMRKELPGLLVSLVLSTNIMALASGAIMLVVLLAGDTRRFFSTGAAPPGWQPPGPRRVDPLLVTAALCQLFGALFLGAMRLSFTGTHGELQMVFGQSFDFTADWVSQLNGLCVSAGLLLLAALPMQRWLRGLLLGLLIVGSILGSIVTPLLFQSIYSVGHFAEFPWKTHTVLVHLRYLFWLALLMALAYKVRHRTSIPALIFQIVGAGFVILLTWIEPVLVGKFWRSSSHQTTRMLLTTGFALLSGLVLLPGRWTRWLAGVWLVLALVLLVYINYVLHHPFLVRATLTTSQWIQLLAWWFAHSTTQLVASVFVGIRILEAFDPDPREPPQPAPEAPPPAHSPMAI